MSSRTFNAAFLFLAVLALCPFAFAIEGDQVIDPSNPAAADSAENGSDAMGNLFSGQSSSTGALITFVGYALIIGAIAVVVWYLLKRGFIRKPFAKGEGKLRIAETRMLGNRQFISVVEYEDQKILIGVGPGKIDYLTTLRSYGSEFPQVDEAPSASQNEGGFQA